MGDPSTVPIVFPSAPLVPHLTPYVTAHSRVFAWVTIGCRNDSEVFVSYILHFLNFMTIHILNRR